MFGPGVMVGSDVAADGVTRAARLREKSADVIKVLAYILRLACVALHSRKVSALRKDVGRKLRFCHSAEQPFIKMTSYQPQAG